jgi:hypothetical protein
MSASAIPDPLSPVLARGHAGRRAWQAALAALFLAGLSPSSQATSNASQGKLVLTETADTAEIEGNRIHDWQRHYRQGMLLNSDFGPGWGSLFHARLVLMPGGAVVIAGGDAAPVEYPARDEKSRDEEAFRLSRETEKQHRQRDAQELRRDPVLRAQLVLDLRLDAPPTPSGTRWRHPLCAGAGVLQREQGFVHTPCQGPVEYFDREGRLTEVHFRPGASSIKDRARNILRLGRDAAGALLSVADGSGDRIDFVREDNRIVAARARHGTSEMEIRFAYDRGGRLESVKRVLGPDKLRTLRSYSYDAEGRLEQAGKSRFSYDAADRLAIIESDIARQAFSYTLADDGTLVTRMEWQARSGSQAPVVQVSESDKYGRTVVSYDAGGTRILMAPLTGQVLMRTDTRGVEWRFTSGAGQRLAMITGSNGDQAQFKYGGNGLPSELKLSAGPAGKSGEPTDYGQLLAPDTSAVIKLVWHAKDKPTRIAWMGRCLIRKSYGADGEPIAEASLDGTPECVKQLGGIYSSFF